MDFGWSLSKHVVGLWLLWIEEGKGVISLSSWVEDDGVVETHFFFSHGDQFFDEGRRRRSRWFI